DLSILRLPVLTEDAGNAPCTGCARAVRSDERSGQEAQEDEFERADEHQPPQMPHILIHCAHGLSRSPAKWAGSSTAPCGARGRRDLELMGWASWTLRLMSTSISRRCGCGCGFRQQARRPVARMNEGFHAQAGQFAAQVGEWGCTVAGV
ncbi:hypothetical protein B0H10DRAFT_2121087, partial [Mycena sp. CBHHK59/15]